MQPLERSETASALAPGTLLGGRFAIEGQSPAARSALGEVLLARDQKTNKPVAVRVLSPAFAGDNETFAAIKSEIRTAAKLKHRSLIGTYGIGTHENHHFVACEWVQGTSLSDFIARRAQQGALLSLRGVYNLIAHLAKALTHVHTTTCHGALRPSVVWITGSGRVKLGELGLSLALANSGTWRMLDAAEHPFLAPEIRAGASATVRSDVYGVGALLYALLTTKAPSAQLLPVSKLRGDATAELDAVISACLDVDPAARYASVQEISHALLALVATAPESTQADEFGVDVEIDVDVALSIAPAAPRAPLGPPSPAPQVALPVPNRAKVATPNGGATRDPFAPRPPSTPGGEIAAARDPFAPRAPSTPGGEVAPVKPRPPENKLADLTAKLAENDAPRWMAVKDGLDHGPFTIRELIKLIVEGQILEQHILLNMSSNDKKPLREWPEFHEFIEQYKLRKAEADHAIALQKSTRIERGGNMAKFLILGGSIIVLLVAGGGYLMSRRAAQRAAQHDVNLAAMFESGKVKISGTAGILKAGPRTGGARRAGSSDTGGGFTSYDDAMNVAMELGDATKGGGEQQLRPADIEGVMNRKLNTLFSCVGQELRSGGRLGTVQMDLAIMGSGQVAGASISAGSPAFKSCMVAKLRQVHFPSFSAPRMGARYSFSVN